MQLPQSDIQTTTNLEHSYNIEIGKEESSIILTFLRDNIYKDPILATFKEPFSNALDSHTESNVSRPVEITTPSPLHPYLTIRDFGKGLSKHFMTTQYTKAGSSTKRSDNSTLGGWGIGRLSPLSYSDTFTLDSFTIEAGNTIQRTYLISLSEHLGKSSISLLLINETISKEPSGLKVSVPIQTKHFDSFKLQAEAHCLYLFQNTPIINGSQAATVTKVIESPCSNWFIQQQSSTNYNTLALLNNLPFNLPVDKVTELLRKHNLYFLSHSGLVFNLPVGSVSQTASKDIQITELTTSTLEQAILTVKAELIEVIQQKVNQIPSFTALLKFCQSLKTSHFHSQVSWQSKPIQWYLNSIDSFRLQSSYSSRLRDSKYYLDKVTLKDYKFSHLIILDKDISATRLHQLIDYLYPIHSVLFLKCPTELYPTLDLPLVTSLLPPTISERKTRKSKDKSQTKAYIIRKDVTLKLYCSTNLVNVPIEPSQPMYYLTVDDDLDKLNTDHHLNRLSHYMDLYIFQIKPPHPNWIHLKDYIQTSVGSYLAIPYSLEFFTLDYTTRQPFLEFPSNLIKQSCDISRFYQLLNNLYKEYYKLSSQQHVLLSIYKQENIIDDYLKQIMHTLRMKYPLIFQVDYLQNICISDIEHYITLINNA